MNTLSLDAMRHIRHAKLPVPEIAQLFAFNPDRSMHLAQFTRARCATGAAAARRLRVDRDVHVKLRRSGGQRVFDAPGWNRAASDDAMIVCALFKIDHACADAPGVRGRRAATHAMSGTRTAAQRYIR